MSGSPWGLLLIPYNVTKQQLEFSKSNVHAKKLVPNWCWKISVFIRRGNEQCKPMFVKYRNPANRKNAKRGWPQGYCSGKLWLLGLLAADRRVGTKISAITSAQQSHGRMTIIRRCTNCKDSQKQAQKIHRLLLPNTSIIAWSHFLNKYYRKTGPGLSIKLSERTFQVMAKMMAQVNYLGFIARYKFNILTYCSL